MHVVTTKSSWVVGTMCHCRPDYDAPPQDAVDYEYDDDGVQIGEGTLVRNVVGADPDTGEPMVDGDYCDDHWDIWVTPAPGEIGRIVIARGIQFYAEAEHIVKLHNAFVEASS